MRWHTGDHVVLLDDGSEYARTEGDGSNDHIWCKVAGLGASWADDPHIEAHSPTLIARGGQPVPTGTTRREPERMCPNCGCDATSAEATSCGCCDTPMPLAAAGLPAPTVDAHALLRSIWSLVQTTRQLQGEDFDTGDWDVSAFALLELFSDAEDAGLPVPERSDNELRRQALLEAANEVHVEARWQTELLMRGEEHDGDWHLERLRMIEEILLDRSVAAVPVVVGAQPDDEDGTGDLSRHFRSSPGFGAAPNRGTAMTVEDDRMNLPTSMPSPLDWHPAYADETWLLRWLDGRDGAYTSCYWEIEFPIPRAQIWTADQNPIACDYDRRRMSRQRCAGFAPYVGRPFVYEWWAGVDDLGRCIAGESRIVYLPE